MPLGAADVTAEAELLPPGAPEFSERFRGFRYTCYRLETLPVYRSSGEDAALAAFLAGRPWPASPGHEQWQAMVRANIAAGRRMQRVHVVSEPLTDYLRLELTWGYAVNADAGEDIGVIPVREGEGWPVDVPRQDYWLFDSQELWLMAYDSQGTWLGQRLVTDPQTVLAACFWRDAALHQAVSWRDYIAGRPELARHLPAPARAS